jgi:O-methyltransferase
VLRYSIDEVNSDRILGWAFDPDEPPEVTVVIEGKPVGQARMGTYRIDVAQSLGDGRAATSGFEYRFDADAFRHVAQRSATIELHVGPERMAPVTVPVVVPSGRAVPSRAPFPPAVVQLLQGYADAYDAPVWSDDAVMSAVHDLRFLVERGPRAVPELHRYLAYVAQLWVRAAHVERYFPRTNAAAGHGEKDESGVQNSALEVFAVGLHLATLRAAGVPGHFLEFGCFKGFSTAILSEACDRLGVAMHVFDSFAGLPPSDSQYYSAGDFSGSRPEVERNVDTYGQPRGVEYHEGFFSDTLPGFDPGAVMALWMDVDLESSSRDVMAILPRLDERGVVFSHECSPEMFLGAEIRAERGADFVVPPILDAFKSRGWPVRGRHIHGHTGAFWHADDGIPPIPTAASTALRDLALEL